MKSRRILAMGVLLVMFGVVGRVEAAFSIDGNVGIYQTTNTTDSGKCYGPCYSPDQEIVVEIVDVSYNGEPIQSAGINLNNGPTITVNAVGKGLNPNCSFKLDENGSGSCSFTVNANPDSTSKESVKIEVGWSMVGQQVSGSIEKATINFYASCDGFTCNEEPGSSIYELCAQIPPDQGEAIDRCYQCFDDGGIWTAVGCISREPSTIIETIIRIGLVVAGAVVLVIILVASFMLSTSQGDPNKTKEAKDLITSAVIGILFIIFSITILQFIGVSILHIPGFGE